MNQKRAEAASATQVLTSQLTQSSKEMQEMLGTTQKITEEITELKTQISQGPRRTNQPNLNSPISAHGIPNEASRKPLWGPTPCHSILGSELSPDLNAQKWTIHFHWQNWPDSIRPS